MYNKEYGITKVRMYKYLFQNIKWYTALYHDFSVMYDMGQEL